MKIALADEMRRIDKIAIETFKIPELILMENAGRAVANVTGELLGSIAGKTISVLAGSGGNGGDAFSASRHLFNRGARIRVFFLGDPEKMKDSSRTNRLICEKLGIPVQEIKEERDWEKLKVMIRLSDGVIDGILGTGFRGPLREDIERLIKLVNESARPVVAIDIPSGVDADTGVISSTAVMAGVTATFGLPKAGHFFSPGADASGRLVVDDISLPGTLLNDGAVMQEYMDDETVRAMLPPRPLNAHKGACGRVLVVAGSRGMTGAAALSSEAALRAGAGISLLASAESLTDVFSLKLTEVMTRALPEIQPGILGESAVDAASQLLSKADSALIGPGLGRSPDTGAFIRRLAARVSVPLVLDADALYAFHGQTDELKKLEGTVVLTPHLGEMADLLGIGIPKLKEGLIAHARKAAADWGKIIVLKSECTIVAYPDGRIYFTSKGNPSMATAGSGDVLSGVIAGLMRQTAPDCAPLVGVWLHGMAGDIAAKEKAEGLMAGDILDNVPVARRLLQNGENME